MRRGKSPPRPPSGEVCADRQRQWRRPGGHLRQQGRGRARHRHRPAEGRQARHPAAGERPLPLRLDGAGRRGDGGGAGRRRDQGAGGAAGRQCPGRPDQRSGGDPPAAGRTGDRHGALARIDCLARRRRGRSSSSRSAPARCSPASPGASSTAPRRLRSARRPISTPPSPNSAEEGTRSMFELTGQARFGDRRERRHRRRHRPRLSPAGRHRRPVGHAPRGARGAGRRAWRAHGTCCPAISAMRPRWSSSCRRPRRRLAARSTSWSTMPASPATCSSRA